MRRLRDAASCRACRTRNSAKRPIVVLMSIIFGLRSHIYTILCIFTDQSTYAMSPRTSFQTPYCAATCAVPASLGERRFGSFVIALGQPRFNARTTPGKPEPRQPRSAHSGTTEGQLRMENAYKSPIDVLVGAESLFQTGRTCLHRLSRRSTINCSTVLSWKHSLPRDLFQ